MLYNKLKKMRERQGVFSCQNVEDLLTFIEGYGSALSENNISDKDFNSFKNFNEFVKNCYSIESTHANWSMMIKFNSSNDEESMRNFFLILDQYYSTLLK